MMEDCDDLVPLFKQHQMLDQTADDFYVAMLIEAPSPNHQIVCQLPNGKVVGFMSLTPVSTAAQLDQLYDLSPYELCRSFPIIL
jgi:hypothetical protein